MSEQELCAIETNLRVEGFDAVGVEVPALIAEVRRLRRLVAAAYPDAAGVVETADIGDDVPGSVREALAKAVSARGREVCG